MLKYKSIISLTLLALASVSLAAYPGATARADSQPDNTPEPKKTVRVFAKREGGKTTFFVENNELCEITMTFEMRMTNLKSSVDLPYTAVFPAGQTTAAFTVEPQTSNPHWEYAYTNYYKLGSNLAQPDSSYVYELPYSAGKRFIVTQAYNGSFSHKGSNKYAIDWKMPEGTLVRAARGGKVVKVKQDSNQGGGNMSYDKFNNFVLIRHDDGTLGHYCHLQKNGVLVKPGDRVSTGQPIAYSGNTGFSSGPHLHFCLFRTRSGLERESIPALFRTADQTAVTLVEDRRYRATEVGSSTASMAEARSSANQGGVSAH